MVFTTILPAPSPSASLFDIAPVAPPAGGTQLISDLQWNNLIDILDGISVDKLSALSIASGIVSDTEFDFLNGITSQVASLDDIQIFTNKTINATNNTITNLTNAALLAGVFSSINGLGVQSQLLNMGNNLISAVLNPISGSDAATKDYVDNLVNGLSWKNPARLATTADITLSGNQTIDGFLTVTGDRVLVKDQTLGQENGLYAAAAGAWTRTIDADSEADLLNMSVYVTAGTGNEDTSWVLTTDPPIVVDTTPLNYVQVGAGPGNPLTTKGDLFGRDASAGARVPVGADNEFLVANAAAAEGVSYSLVNDANINPGRFANITGVSATLSLLTDDTRATLELEANHTVPSVGDSVGVIDFWDDDSAGNRELYGRIETIIRIPTNNLEDSKMEFSVQNNSNLVTLFEINGETDIVNINTVLDMNGNAINTVPQINFNNLTMNIDGSGSTFFDFNVGSGEFLAFRVNGDAPVIIGGTNPALLMTEATLQETQGGDIASVGAMTLGTDGNYFNITGTTNISTISSAGVQNGTIMKLKFDGVLTITHGTSPNQVNFADNQNHTTIAGEVITIVRDAAVWVEISRSSDNSASIQTLTNKTIDGDLNTILDINETQQNVSFGIAGFVLTSNGVGLAPTYQSVAAGSQTPWTSDIAAATFNLSNFGVLSFDSPATSAPGQSNSISMQPGTFTQDMELRVSQNNGIFKFYVGSNATPEFELKNNTLDMHGNAFTNPGNFLDANNNELIVWNGIASAVNHLLIQNATTGNAPVIRAGDFGDASVGLNIQSRGNGTILFANTSNEETLALVQLVGSAANYIQITNAATTTGPIISVEGSDADIDMNFDTKGTGDIIFLSKALFTPGATFAGLNVGATADPDPTVPINGDIYYNSTNNKFRAYENGSWVDMIAAGGGEVFTWTADHNAAGFDLLFKAATPITMGQGATDLLSVTFLDDTVDAGMQIGNTDGFISFKNKSAVIGDNQMELLMSSGGATTIQNVMNFQIPVAEDSGTTPVMKMNFQDFAGGPTVRPLMAINHGATELVRLLPSTEWQFHPATNLSGMARITLPNVTTNVAADRVINLDAADKITWQGVAASTPNYIMFTGGDIFQVFINNALQFQVTDTSVNFLNGDLDGVNSYGFQLSAAEITSVTAGMVLDSPTETSFEIGGVQKFFMNSSFFDMGNVHIKNLNSIRGNLTGTPIILKIEEVASAVEYLQITNAVSGAGPILESNGTAADIDLNIATKGSGFITFNDFVKADTQIQLKYGGTVASAASMSSFQGGNFYDVTGSATINFLVDDIFFQAGHFITFQFDGAATLTHNASTPPTNFAIMLLKGDVDFVATAGDIITFVFNGLEWEEVSRNSLQTPGLVMVDATDIVLGTTTGTKFGTSTSQKLGFFNATPIIQPTALTAQDTTITHTAPGVADFAIQDLTSTTPFGFVTKDEGNTVLQVIANLQTRVDELETKLQALGFLA